MPYILFSFLLSILTFSPAFAQSATAQGAEDVREMLNDMIERDIGILDIAAGGNSELVDGMVKLEGETTVVPKDGYYEAKLPYITLNVFDTYTLDIGRVAMNISPSDNNSQWLTTIALPRNMPLLDSSGKEAGGVSFASQTFKGVMDVEREVFTRFDGRYEGLKIRGLQGMFVQNADIGEIEFSQDFKPSANDPTLYTGPVEFTARNVSGETIIDGEVVKRYTVESAEGTTEYSGMPLFDRRSFQEQLMQSSDNPLSFSNSMASQIFKILDYMPQNGTTVAKARNVSMINFPNDPDLRTSVTTAEMNARTSAKDMRSDQARFSSDYTMTGMSYTGYPESYQAYLPTRSRFNSELINVPVNSLIDAMQTQAANMNGTPEINMNGDVPGTQINLPELFAENKTQLRIENTELIAPEVSLFLSGLLTAQTAAERGFVGDMNLRVQGMDQAVQSLRTVMQENPALRMFGQQILLGLTLAQTAGKLDSDGTSRIYDLKVAPDGRILLNGADFSGFFGGYLPN